ncbi:molybdenum ABC transporter, periplasmic molybdate-binding protein ModA [Burkholderiales bacterium GJ-E10]|nr:molybdenum ABC transporter, periplasmic molybdate-binding protein ModA [Burkholderiales bacterium GJ-E10]
MQFPFLRTLRALPAIACLFILLPGPARADDLRIAVAANFTEPVRRIAAEFERETGNTVKASFGATGLLYAQIRNGAPFEILLAADAATPRKLVKEGLGVASSEFPYAIGTLVLWSAKPGFVDGHGAVLRSGRFAHLAYCDPKLAPYGAAAVATMRSLGIYEALKPKLVEGQNISQAYQFVASGTAELGFVALSQVFRDGRFRSGSAWVVPAARYSPIRQDAVLLRSAKDHPAAIAFLRFLRSEPAKAVIRSYGYGISE